MSYWKPDKRWEGADVYVIGGGPSLSGFNWELLKGRATIGCNAAFRLGADICQVCFFSDYKWLKAFDKELSAFKGDVVTHCQKVLPERDLYPFLKVLPRATDGLHPNAIGFGSNSGCGAVNLAILLGARRVFLLGFDCRPPVDDKSHWHDWRIEKPNTGVYDKFMDGWRRVAEDLSRKFQRHEVINLGPDSAITYFPKADINTHFAQ